MNSLFKRGDRVKVISSKSCSKGCREDGTCKFIGHIGIVKESPYSGEGEHIYVFPFKDVRLGCSGFTAEDLEHVTKDWDE